MSLEFAGTVEDRGNAEAPAAAATFSPRSGSLGALETSAMLRLTPETAHMGWEKKEAKRREEKKNNSTRQDPEIYTGIQDDIRGFLVPRTFFLCYSLEIPTVVRERFGGQQIASRPAPDQRINSKQLV